MSTEPFGRLDHHFEIREKLLPYCRLKAGEIGSDSQRGHKIGVQNAVALDNVQKIFGHEKAVLGIQDPPYNVAVGAENTNNLFKWNLKDYDESINRNLFLYVFEITAPRGFGDTWAFGHLHELEPDFKRPNKKVDETLQRRIRFILRLV
ncbi:MAG: hypothetical protein LBT05_08205 [Planctomycetaceae bacterium]|jgi:hypothetical protein|nr:hypothetical protein [Planctomycetaceae bacterium]